MSRTNKLKEIRDAVVAKLVDETEVEDRVFPNRVRRIWRAKYPCLLVYVLAETAQQRSSVSPTQDGKQRTATVVVEAVAEANESLDDVLLDLAVEVEQLLTPEEELGGLVAELDYGGIEVQMREDAVASTGGAAVREVVVGVARITYQAKYFT